MSDFGSDPFVDPNDPEAVERAERRREREEKRAQKAAKKRKDAPPPPPPPKAEPPAVPRTPEQEFWDEPAEPAPPVPGQEPGGAKDVPVEEERGRRGLFGRRKKVASAAAASGAAAASEAEEAGGAPAPAARPATRASDPADPDKAAAAPPAGSAPAPKASPPGDTLVAKEPPPGEAPAAVAPPTGETPTAKAAPTPAEAPAAKAPPPTTGESARPQGAAPATGEQPIADAGPPTAEQPMPKQPDKPTESGPPTGEEPIPQSGPPTAEEPIPPTAAPTAEGPVADSGPPTGEEPIPPSAPPTAEQPVADAGPPTAEQPIPPQTEAPHAPTAEVPQPDPGPGTAATPRRDPNQPTASNAVAGDPGSGGGRRRALPPRPAEETGAGDWEPPPPRDDDWFDEEDFHDDGDPDMAGAARHGRRHGEDGGRRGGFLGALLRHPFRILAVIVLIVILLFANALFQPFHGDGHGHVAVKIPKGSSVGEVGDLLEKKGVISGGFIIPGSTLFQARVTLDGKRSSLFAGKFTMAKDMSYGDVIDQLSKEPKVAEQSKPGIVTVTIPEGQSRPITAKLVKEDGLKGNYLKATKKSKYLNPAQYGGKGAKNLEGFLFPDTWEYKTKHPVSYLVRLQLEDFKKKIKKVNMKYAKSKNLTVYDVVTIASIIEREAGVPKQRKLVASVIYNRLHDDMTLGMDSTIRFATGNYEKPLTESELESESPYNTRNHAGLPPGPINSPGLGALNAAAHPAKTEYLFFVNNPNSCNELAFSKTEEEFLENEAKYSKAREKNGGNQPSTCK